MRHTDTKVLRLAGVTANTTFTVPAGYRIQSIDVQETAAAAITGGVKIGTTDGGIDVVVALAVGANALTFVLDSALLRRFFSAAADTTLYLQTVTLWNAASIDVQVVLIKVK